MAEVAKTEKKKNRVLEFLSKEYKYENLILVLLAIFAIVLGVLILIPNEKGGLTVDEGFFLIGSYPRVFAWILVVLGGLSLLLVLWPFYKPSVSEIRHITGLKRSEFFENIISVLIFILVLAFFFLLVDLIIKSIILLFS